MCSADITGIFTGYMSWSVEISSESLALPSFIDFIALLTWLRTIIVTAALLCAFQNFARLYSMTSP